MSGNITSTDRDAYNLYTQLPNYSYRLIQHLLENNELIWKLLKHPNPDAWMDSVTNLTQAEKGALIWNGRGDASDFNVFMDDGIPDVETQEVTRLNILPYGISPRNRTVGDITLLMEVYSHYKINTLSNYTTRVDTILQQLLETFNGSVVEGLGIGRIFFDKRGAGATRMELGGQIPFRGKWLLFASKTATE